MNIGKQDERLLHEILSKYKQGLISGLIQGNNVTFTSTGCRNKVISSTGGGTSALLPNGIKQVGVSRDLQADDAGHYIVLDSDDENPVILTMPVTNPFQIGDNFEITSNDSGNGYDVNGEVTYITNGNRILFTNTNDGSDNPQILEVANYNLGGFIPLSGTEIGKPVTGDIDFANANIIFNNIDGDKFIKFGFNTATDETGLYFDNGLDPQTRFSIYNGDIQCYMPIGSYFSFANDYLGFSNNGNSSFVGIRGGEDYSNIITDLDYTQKIYVDNIAGKIITLGTITYEDLNNTGIGENNVIIPLDFQNVPTDYYIECFYYDVSEAFDKAMSNDAEITTQDPSLTSTINIDSLSRTVKRTTSTIFPAGVESTGDTFTIHLTDANNGTSTAGSVTIKALVKKFPN